MSTYSQSKTKPGTRGQLVDVAGLSADLDVNPAARGFHANAAGVLAIWGPDDDLAAASIPYTVAEGITYAYEVRRIDESASTVTEIVLLF